MSLNSNTTRRCRGARHDDQAVDPALAETFALPYAPVEPAGAGAWLPRPRPLWVVAATAIMLIGTSMLAWLLVAGYRHTGWPAHYLHDDEPGTWLTALCLALSGIVCFLAAGRSARPQARRFWIFFAVAFLFVAADDLLRFHERIDLALHALIHVDARNPVTDRIDDLIMLGYGLTAAWYAYRRRDEVLRLRWTACCLGAAFALFTMMVACDITHVSATVEDTLKSISILFILIGCLAAYLDPAL